jgi:hypothetical protein
MAVEPLLTGDWLDDALDHQPGIQEAVDQRRHHAVDPAPGTARLVGVKASVASRSPADPEPSCAGAGSRSSSGRRGAVAGPIRLCVAEAHGEHRPGEQRVPVRLQSRQALYELELAAFVAVVRGVRPPDRSLDHELLASRLTASPGPRGGSPAPASPAARLSRPEGAAG